MTIRAVLAAILLITGLTVTLSIVLTHPITAQELAQHPGQITVTLEPGDSWESYFRILWLFKQAKRPQMAFWIEDREGRFAATLYVTRRTALQDWRAMPFQDATSLERPSSLPVWTHRHIRGGIHPIESCTHCHDRIRSADKSMDGDPVLDALTGATPEDGFTRDWQIPPDLAPGEYVVWAELNHSFDYNDVYPDDLNSDDPAYSGVSGQPSVVWAGRLTIGNGNSQVVLEPVGHGHPAGTNGRVYPLDDGITSARDIASQIEVRVIP